MSRQPHILVADGEHSIRLLLETGLALNGFRVTSVRTGREALEAAGTGAFDAVLGDIEFAGLELLEGLRAADPHLPIVLMTASAEAAVEAVARGANDFIGKPFEIPAVVGLLRRHLEMREARDQTLIADRPTMDELQRRYLQFILDETGWNRRRAAAVLDLDRRTIQRLIARYQLHSPTGAEEEEMEAGDAQ
jgi:DNA-binding NtrC family response regulator